MRLVTFTVDTPVGIVWRVGALAPDERVVDLTAASAARRAAGAGTALGWDGGVIPPDVIRLLAAGPDGLDIAREVLAWALAALDGDPERRAPDGARLAHAPGTVRLRAPVPRPPRLRDFLTFEGHAKGAGLHVPDVYYQVPLCYKGNPFSVVGPDDELRWPAYTEQLDYELEFGVYVGLGGSDVPRDQAHRHMAGITLFNDVSARDIQNLERPFGMGPFKGKDFCTAMGPCLTTMDELPDEDALRLVARVNGEVWSEGLSGGRVFSLADLVAWCSYGEELQPGEFIAVGTIPRGCGLELGRWIQPGDVVELEMERVGVLRNRVGARQSPDPRLGVPTYHGAPRWERR